MDKVFLLCYSFDRNGRFYKWSPLQKDYNLRLLRESLNLPNNSGKKIVEVSKYYQENSTDNIPLMFVTNDLPRDLIMENYILLYRDLTSSTLDDESLRLLAYYYNFLITEDTRIDKEILKLKIISKILDRLNEVGQMRIHKNLDSDALDSLIVLLNKHNTYIPELDGLKNFMIHTMHMVMSNGKNFTTAYKSIDTATGRFTDPIGNIQESFLFDIDDGHTINKSTEAAAVGKDGVGISANADKDFMTTLAYMNNYFLNDPPFSELELQESAKFNVKHILLALFKKDSNLQYTTERVMSRHYYLGPISDTLLNDTQRAYYNHLIKKIYGKDASLSLYTDDAALDIGALMSLAADNAKTLALDKIHASTTFFPIHLYLAMMGISPEDIVDYSNGPAFKALARAIKNNLVEGNVEEVDYVTFDQARSPYVKIVANATSSELEKKEAQQMIDDLNQLEEIYNCGLELTEMAGILKINLGLDIKDPYSLVSIKSKLKSNWRRMLKEFSRFLLINAVTGMFIEAKTTTDDVAQRIIEAFLTKWGVTGNTTGMLLHINSKMQLANRLMQRCNITLSTPFNFDRFLSDPLYRYTIVTIDDIMKHLINMFDAFSNSPHFFKMLQVYNLVLKTSTTKNAALEFIMNTGEDLYDSFTINSYNEEKRRKVFEAPKTYGRLISNGVQLAINDYFLANFCLTLEPYNFSMQGNRMYKVDFTSDEGCNELIDFINFELLPALIQMDPGNAFLLSLDFHSLEFEENKNIFAGLSFNLNAIKNKIGDGATRFMQLWKAFENISHLTLSEVFGKPVSDLTVGDMLYLYNSFMHETSPRLNNFDGLMFNMYYDPNSLKYKYMKFILDYDEGRRLINYDLRLFMAAVFKRRARLTGGSILFKRKYAVSSEWESVDMHYTDSTGRSRNRLLVNLPTKHQTTVSIELLEKLVNGYKNGDINIEFNLNCE